MTRGSEKIPAAQYLRMSTEHQQYSIPCQVAAISKYAELNGFAVVKTYTDPGRSGLRIHNRPGLTALLQDVISGNTDYRTILVYDVSRWGRFQDCDEAAHYEFLCRSRGIPVHYCAEQFTNEATAVNILLKWLKRTMAAEFSRELSVKVYNALHQAAEQGCWLGSFPGYGLRRMLFSPEGIPKRLLAHGERKSLKTDRVKLVLGPPEEIEVVRLIYRMLLQEGLGPTAIARELNRRHIGFCSGRTWSCNAVTHVLTHPKYCGVQVWGRSERKFGGPTNPLPKDRWVTAPNPDAAIVDERTFARAQQVYPERVARRMPDAQLLDDLRKLWRRKGYLSTELIATSPLRRSLWTYYHHFGSMSKAYELIGYQGQKRMASARKKAHRHSSVKLRRNLSRRLQQMFPGRVVAGPYAGCITYTQPRIDVFLSVLRSSIHLGRRIWLPRSCQQQRHAVTLLCLLNRKNNGFEAFYVFPRLQHDAVIYRNGALLAHAARLSSLRDFCRAIIAAHDQLPESEKNTDVLVGVQHIAKYLGRSVSAVYRLLPKGMPTGREGRFIAANREELNRWIAQSKPRSTKAWRFRCPT